MLDAALFEPGAWQPDGPKPVPATIPAADRAAMATPAGLLFQELTHAPAPLLRSLSTLVYNALELDAGRSAAIVISHDLPRSPTISPRARRGAVRRLPPPTSPRADLA